MKFHRSTLTQGEPATGRSTFNGGRFGVEPVCTVLAEHGVRNAPSTCYAAKRRPASTQALRDVQLALMIARVYTANCDSYGAAKVWDNINRAEDARVARCTFRRLVRRLDLRGVGRGPTVRTTAYDPDAERPADLVNRCFAVAALNRP